MYIYLSEPGGRYDMDWNELVSEYQTEHVYIWVILDISVYACVCQSGEHKE